MSHVIARVTWSLPWFHLRPLVGPIFWGICPSADWLIMTRWWEGLLSAHSDLGTEFSVTTQSLWAVQSNQAERNLWDGVRTSWELYPPRHNGTSPASITPTHTHCAQSQVVKWLWVRYWISMLTLEFLSGPPPRWKTQVNFSQASPPISTDADILLPGGWGAKYERRLPVE